MLRSLGPDWSQAHQQKAFSNPGYQRPDPSYTYQTRPLQVDGVTMAVLGVGGAGRAARATCGCSRGKYLKASLLGHRQPSLGLAVVGLGLVALEAGQGTGSTTP